MYLIQKCYNTKLQIVTLIIGLIAGILAFASFLHLSIIFWNYEYTYPEDLFIFYNAKNYNTTMYKIYTDYKTRMEKLCEPMKDLSRSRKVEEWLRFGKMEIVDMGSVDRKKDEHYNVKSEETNSSYNKTEHKYDQGNFTLDEKYPIDIQILKRRVRELIKRRAVQYKRLSSTSSKCNGNENNCANTFRTRYDSPLSYKRTSLLTGIEPIEEIGAEFGGSLRKPRGSLWKPRATFRFLKSVTIMEKCQDRAKQLVYEFNIRLNVGRKVLMGNVEDQVTTTVMMVQLIAYLIDIIFIIANALLLIGAGLRRSSYIIPWMSFWWPFIIIHLFYIWVEWFLYSEASTFGLTIAVFFTYFVLLIVTVVLGFFLFWLVWSFYYLLFTPEEYMEQLSSISQLVVTGRNIRG